MATSPSSAIPLIHALTLIDAALFIIQMILLPFRAHELGLHNDHLGHAATIFAVAQLAGNPVFGWLTDRVSIRTSFYITFTSWTVLLGFTGFATSYATLVVPRVFAALALGMAAAQSAIPKLTDGQARDDAMAKLGAMFGLGMILGPMVGGGLAHFLGNTAALYLAAGGCVAVKLLLVSRLPTGVDTKKTDHGHAKSDSKEKTNSRGLLENYKHILGKPQVAALMIIKAVAMAPFIIQEPILSMYNIRVLQVTAAQSAAVAAVMGVLMVLAIIFIVPQIRARLSNRGVFQLATVCIMWTYGGFCFYESVTQLYWIQVGMMLAVAMVQTAVDASLGQLVDTSESGAAFGLSNGLISLVAVVGPICGSYAELWLGFNTIIYLGVITAAVVYAMSWQVDGTKKSAEIAPSPGDVKKED